MLSILFDNNDAKIFEKTQVATMEVKLPPIVAVTQAALDSKLVHVAHRVESKLQKIDPATATFIRGRQIQLIVDRYTVFQQLREGGRFEYSAECKALLATEETIARAVHHILHENHQIFKKNENQFVTKTPNRRTNGADDLNTIFKPLVKNWSEGQCEFHGRQWQFVLDSYGRRTSGVELAKKSWDDIVELAQQIQGRIRNGFYKKRKQDPLYDDDQYRCQCGRRENCGLCYEDFCRRKGTACNEEDCNEAICGNCERAGRSLKCGH